MNRRDVITTLSIAGGASLLGAALSPFGGVLGDRSG